jgi:hypothetical protein
VWFSFSHSSPRRPQWSFPVLRFTFCNHCCRLCCASCPCKRSSSALGDDRKLLLAACRRRYPLSSSCACSYEFMSHSPTLSTAVFVTFFNGCIMQVMTYLPGALRCVDYATQGNLFCCNVFQNTVTFQFPVAFIPALGSCGVLLAQSLCANMETIGASPCSSPRDCLNLNKHRCHRPHARFLSSWLRPVRHQRASC